MLKVLNNLKKKNFGASSFIGSSATKSFGLPASRNCNAFVKYKRVLLEFLPDDLLVFFNDRLSKSVNLTILSSPSVFGQGLRRYLQKRIRVLKSNRSYRGVRHLQSLPVRYQRSKTNARTQKVRRR
jgi:bifunctional pyridoxal-dependent enzyme with beta-cystathionase and maltose regulon repressor activities